MINVTEFYGKECAPCKMLRPILEKLAAERSDVSVEFKDVEECGVLAQQYRVRSLPTLIFEKYGVVVAQLVGLVDRTTIDKTLEGLQ